MAQTSWEMTPEEPLWECAVDARADVGEVPIWSPDDKSLYWIDVFAGLLNRTDVSTDHTQTWATGEVIGCYALASIRR